MSCLSCDGGGVIQPPAGESWLLTGKDPMPCPVCRGPHFRWLLDQLGDHGVIECSHETCEREISQGWLVYAQLRTSVLPALDEAMVLCCGDHWKVEAGNLKNEGHPTVVIPFCLTDAKESI